MLAAELWGQALAAETARGRRPSRRGRPGTATPPTAGSHLRAGERV